jgi:peptidoglycan/xylan/chitin deacetylase (PgdA/CDA1 family)
MAQKESGKFIISLDFELLWGVRDKRTVNDYGDNIKAVWTVLPKMLELFDKYEVDATFATVGFLFAADLEDLKSYLPSVQPQYHNSKLSPYHEHLKQEAFISGHREYHFARELIELIKKYPGQELASHTFCHYYCLEKGQSIAEFEADLGAAHRIAADAGVSLQSFVFPRNQFNKQYIQVIKDKGILSYRGNEKAWFYKPAKGDDEGLVKRAFRLLDTYLNISGHNTYRPSDLAAEFPFNIPASRFLRPYSKRLKSLEGLRLRRIKKGMLHAAERKEVFHLWWHPHNFGAQQSENLAFLESILEYYSMLKKTYGFESITMGALAQELKTFNK